VLGSNGAGKTTLFNCVTGDFLPTSGVDPAVRRGCDHAFPAHERIRRGLRRTYQISLLFTGLTVSTMSIWPAAGSRAGASRCSGRAGAIRC
jgi:branched-chain amino acid transport system ATP-binding protein